MTKQLDQADGAHDGAAGAPRLRRRIRGIIVPMLTPVVGRHELDKPSLSRLIEHVAAAGVSSVFTLGATGNGNRLTAEQRQDMTRTTVELVAGRFPVMAGVQGQTIEQLLADARSAEKSGAEIAVISLPSHRTPTEAHALMRRFADDSPLPVMAYHNSRTAGVTLKADMLVELVQHPRVLGIKDSSNDFILFQQIFGSLPTDCDAGIYQGCEYLLGWSMLAGAAGGANGWANALPDVCVAQFEAGRRGDIAWVTRLQRAINQLLAYSRPIPMPAIWAAACALGLVAKTIPCPWEALPEERLTGLQLIMKQARDLALAYRRWLAASSASAAVQVRVGSKSIPVTPASAAISARG